MNASPPGLLEVLDSLVRADRAPPGFLGTLCFGVRGRGYWVVQLDGRARGWFAEEPPENADACFGVGEPESLALLGLASMPAEPFAVVTGDRDLLQRFASRYVEKSSLLDLRLDR